MHPSFFLINRMTVYTISYVLRIVHKLLLHGKYVYRTLYVSQNKVVFFYILQGQEHTISFKKI